jgi:hypothetical protein
MRTGLASSFGTIWQQWSIGGQELTENKVMSWKSQDHMMAGVKAAAASPNTPSHLRPHLAKRLAPQSDPLSTNAIADNDNLKAEQQRGMRVAPKKLTKVVAPQKKVAAGPIIGAPMPTASPAQSAVAAVMNPFMRRMSR